MSSDEPQPLTGYRTKPVATGTKQPAHGDELITRPPISAMPTIPALDSQEDRLERIDRIVREQLRRRSVPRALVARDTGIPLVAIDRFESDRTYYLELDQLQALASWLYPSMKLSDECRLVPLPPGDPGFNLNTPTKQAGEKAPHAAKIVGGVTNVIRSKLNSPMPSQAE